MRISVIFIVCLFLTPTGCVIAGATELGEDTKTLENLRADNAYPGLYTGLSNMLDNNTVNYSNDIYTDVEDMNNTFGAGKVVCSLSPPINILVPTNQTIIGFLDEFSLSQRVFDGISDMWLRLPFYPNTTSGSFRVEIYELQRGNSINNIGPDGITSSFNESIIWNYTYTWSSEFLKIQNVSTFDGAYYSFVWLRVMAPIVSVGEYGIYAKWNGSSSPINIYPTEGDSFCDMQNNTKLYLSTNGSIEFDFDFDWMLYITNILHTGIVSLNVEAGQEYRAWLDMNDFTSTGQYLNIVVPVAAYDRTVFLNTTIFYTDTTKQYFSDSRGVNGTGKIFQSFSLSAAKVVDYVRLRIAGDGNLTIFVTKESEQPINTSQVIDASDLAHYSSMPIYGYVSIDSFVISNTQISFIVVPYNTTGNAITDYFLVTQMYAKIQERQLYNKLSEVNRILFVALSGLWTLKVGSMLLVKIIDAELEFLSVIGEWVLNNAFGGVFGWLWGGIENGIGFFLELASAVVPMLFYAGYMIAKGIAILSGVLLCVLVLNGVDAMFKGVVEHDPLKYLGQEWKTTASVMTLLFVVAGFLLKVIDMVIPFN